MRAEVEAEVDASSACCCPSPENIQVAMELGVRCQKSAKIINTFSEFNITICFDDLSNINNFRCPSYWGCSFIRIPKGLALLIRKFSQYGSPVSISFKF